MADAKRDDNRVPVLLAETNDANRTPTPVKVDPVTGRVLVDIDTSSLAAGPGYAATSTTSLLIGTGNKSFTTQADLAYTAGARARASSAADTADYMEGLVVSYSGTTLVINVDTIGGAGTDADWNINLAGNVGATGATGATGAGGAIVEIPFIIDGGGIAITTGQKGHLKIPFACTINQADVYADQSGSIVVDIWKDTYANFPPTVADTITASAKPTLSTAQKSQDTTLTGWTTSISAGDVLAYNVDSATTVTRVVVTLKVTRT